MAKKAIPVLIIGVGLAGAGLFMAMRFHERAADTAGQEAMPTNAPPQTVSAPAAVPAPVATTNATPTATGGLLLYTFPEGAFLDLGGKTVQMSPAEFDGVPVGKMTLTIQKPGYETQIIPVEIKSNEMTDLGTITLTKSGGSK